MNSAFPPNPFPPNPFLFGASNNESDDEANEKLKKEKKSLSTYGYIRQQLKKYNNIYIINKEELINNIVKIIIKYHPLIDIKWITSPMGYKTSNSHLTIRRIPSFGALPAFIDTTITNKMCNKFKIELIIKFLSYGNDFQFGYEASAECKDEDDGSGEIKFKKGLESFKNGDDIKLLFDFVNDEWSIYHNNVEIYKTSLNGNKSILPGISLLRNGETIQIGNCNFYN